MSITRRLLGRAAVGVLALAVPGLPLSAQTATQTPTQVFNAYRATLAKATKVDTVLPFMDAKSRGAFEGMTESQRAGMFELLKKFGTAHTGVKVVKETITGDTAVLTVGGKDPLGQTATGTVPMTKEATGWKVGTEKWSSRPGGL